MTWEDVVTKYRRSHSPDIPPSFTQQPRPLSPASGHIATPPAPAPAPSENPGQAMDIDSTPSLPNLPPSRPAPGESKTRTPLPSGPGPRLEKSLSLPGIESLKNDLQANASRMISTASRNRYTAVHALLFLWQEDDEATTVHSAVRDFADTLEKYYHYTLQIQQIPPSSDGTRSSWRWLSRQLNDFAEDRDQRDVLKIVYYVGHSYLDANREMVLARYEFPGDHP